MLSYRRPTIDLARVSMLKRTIKLLLRNSSKLKSLNHSNLKLILLLLSLTGEFKMVWDVLTTP